MRVRRPLVAETQHASGGARKRPRVYWFERWHPSLDDALHELPEGETCSHDLLKLLADNPSPARKRIALVTERDQPIGVVALRRRNWHWDLVTEGVAPAAFPPVAASREVDVLSALGLFVWVNEWERPVPQDRNVHFVQYEPIFRASTRVDFDAYWRDHGNTNSIKKARKRCEALGSVSLEVDAPDAAVWTVERWEQAWAGDSWAETTAAPDIKAAARYLTESRQYHAFRLLIDEKPVAGLNTFVRGNALVMANSGRDPEFDRARPGVLLDELFFRWSANSPYERVDLGGGFDYKARWSDPDGVRARFSVAPSHLAAARFGLVAARWMKERALSRARREEQAVIVGASLLGLDPAEALRWF